MPFDSKSFVESVPATLEGLAYVLRHRELWPSGFEWDYNECHACAIGMAMKLWSGGGNRRYPISWTKNFFGISIGDADAIFVNLGTSKTPEGRAGVAPEHVASAIECHLSNH